MTNKQHVAPGAVKSLGGILADGSCRRVLLVTGRDSYEACGARRAIAPSLVGLDVLRFCDFSPNPKAEDVRRGVRCFREIRPGAIVAVGGGSVIDMGKLVKYFSATGQDPTAYPQEPTDTPAKTPPLIAIPTTAGSGSEATRFAVLYVGKTKHSVAGEGVLPDAAIVDARLMMSLPAKATAVTGMDALCQAVESYWSVRSTPESQSYAAEAIQRILPSLPEAVHRPDLAARQAMAEAAHLAGKAINISQTTASHAVSYPLTSYFGIPHGQAVAVSLASMVRFNAGAQAADTLDPRGRQYVAETLAQLAGLLDATDADDAARTIERLLDDIGLQSRLGPLGVRTNLDIETVLDHGFNPARVRNNPRRLTRESLREMLMAIR